MLIVLKIHFHGKLSGILLRAKNGILVGDLIQVVFILLYSNNDSNHKFF